MLLKNIEKPTLLLDPKKCLSNIAAMATRAKNAGVHLRPHFKTHQSHEIGNWFRDYGVDRIAVSSLRMAAYFAADSWRDITVAVPVNLREIKLINELSQKTTLNLVAESIEALQYLEKYLDRCVNIMIEVDPGYHRTGLEWEQADIVDAMINLIEKSDKLRFEGLLSHAGHSYHAQGSAEIMNIHRESAGLFERFVNRYKAQFPEMCTSLGDTPTCSTAEAFPGATEIRPGNFVFYDLTQHHIGSCQKEEIAVAMACPVLAKHPSRNQLVIYGGGIHFSKDRLQLPNGQLSYGEVVKLLPDGSWHPMDTPFQVISLSQEHGVVQVDTEWIEKIQPGDLIGVLPVHSCMTADCMKSYLSLEGKKVDMCKIYEW